MKLSILILSIVAALACVRAQAPAASSLSVPERAFRAPEISTLESAPHTFEITISSEMPTPGWTFTVDAVETDERAHRIVALVTENRPEGMVAQVITPAKLRLRLGPLAAGRYVLEIRMRRGTEGEHQPAHAIILAAS